MKGLLWGLAGMLVGVGLLNLAIRRSLAASRRIGGEPPAALPWRDVRLPTANGKQLHGWYIPAPPGSPALVVMHGWGGHAGLMLPLAAPLHAAGYTLLLVDARCHGRSDGDNFASLPRFAEDIEAAMAWLGARPEVDQRAIGLVGHSVGAGAALLAASRQPLVRAVVSLAGFAHPAGMMRRWLATRGIPYRPLGAYVLAYVQHVIGHRFDDIAPCRTIARVACPVLIVHGLDDATVPVAEARQIHAAGTGRHVELLLIPGSHDDYGDIAGQIGPVRQFLDCAMRG